MVDISAARTLLGVAVAFAVAFLPAFAYAWGHPPLPETSNLGEVNAHLSRCIISGLNAGMLGLSTWVVGWGVRTSKDGPILAFRKSAPVEAEEPAPRNLTTEQIAAVDSGPTPAQEKAAALSALATMEQNIAAIKRQLGG